MPNDNNRVLTRRGARQLSQDEIDQTAGGIPTLLSVIITTQTAIETRDWIANSTQLILKGENRCRTIITGYSSGKVLTS